MPVRRDRSAVRSSVIPSAKYCCSGSLLRLANGSTTIDRRGRTRGCDIGVATAAAETGEGFVVGHSHQPLMMMISATAAAAPIAAGTMCLRLGAAVAALDADKSAKVSEHNA